LRAKPLRIAVLGSCQASGFASCLKRLVPDADIVAFTVTMRKSAEIPEIAQRLPSFDLVFTQPLQQPFFGPLRTDELKQTIPSLCLYPHIAFSGFHPDIRAFGHRGKPVPSPTWNLHSGIILAAFAEGVPEKRVPDLFNAYIFALLGYFDEYERAQHFVIGKAKEVGYELQPHIAEWKKGGVFMHIVNHPKIEVLAQLAHLGAKQAGLTGALAPPEGVPDRLARCQTWPVYPELAKRLGVPGTLTFTGRKEMLFGRKTTRTMEIDQVVAESYRTYAELPAGAFTQPQIRSTVALLRAA
jgi:hypothetical protein